MLVCTWEANEYHPSRVVRRYVKQSVSGVWRWQETGGDGWTLREGNCDEADIPADIAAKCKERRGTWPPYVEWPA